MFNADIVTRRSKRVTEASILLRNSSNFKDETCLMFISADIKDSSIYLVGHNVMYRLFLFEVARGVFLCVRTSQTSLQKHLKMIF